MREEVAMRPFFSLINATRYFLMFCIVVNVGITLIYLLDHRWEACLWSFVMTIFTACIAWNLRGWMQP